MARRFAVCAVLAAATLFGAAAVAPTDNPALRDVEAGQRHREQDRDEALRQASAAGARTLSRSEREAPDCGRAPLRASPAAGS